MDDKLINLIVTVIVIGIWVAQFFLKPKQQDTERHFDEDDEDDISERSRNPYAEDPYIKVQEEIRRKIAERKAAQQQTTHPQQTSPATQHGQPQSTQHSRPQPGQHGQPQPSQSGRALATPSRPSVAKEMQPVQRSQQPLQKTNPASPQHRPVVAKAKQPAPLQQQSIDEIRARRELVAQGQTRQGNVTVDRTLRPIPSAQLPDRTFPTAQGHASAQKTIFPTAARSGQAAYHGSTKLRREPNQRNLALKAALRSPGSTRQAVLLREILDKPIGLR